MSLFSQRNLSLGGALPVTLLLSCFGLGASPIPILSIFDLPIIVYLARTAKSPLYTILLFGFMSIGTGLSFHHSSSSAFKSAFDNTGVICMIGSIISVFTLTPILLEKFIRYKFPSHHSFFMFPTLWTLTWLIYRRYLWFGSWGDWAYTVQGSGDSIMQLSSIFGLSGIDFFLACWGNAGANFLDTIFNPKESVTDDDDLEDVIEERRSLLTSQRAFSSLQENRLKNAHRKYFIFAVILIMIISWGAHRTNEMGSSVDPVFTIKVACALGSTGTNKRPLDTMLKISDDLMTRAKIVLWSESAVHIESTDDLKLLFEHTANSTKKYKSYAGIAYTLQIKEKLKNMLSLVAPDGSVIFNYTKSRLIPIAESFSYEAGPGELPLTEIEVPLPKSQKDKGDQKILAHLNISGAICFDMDFPKLISQAAGANFVLSPAQTWSSEIGLEHLRMASVRAIEQGFWLLRCDAGGVSGLVDDLGRIRDWQVASKNGNDRLIWDLPLTEKRETWYSAYGDLMELALLAFVGWIMWSPRQTQHIEDKGNEIWDGIKKLTEQLPKDSLTEAMA